MKHSSFALHIIISAVFILLLNSCGKENKTEVQVSKKDSVKSQSSSGQTDLSNNFSVSYNLEGTLKGKMKIYRSGEKLKQDINSEIMGIQSSNIIYILNNNVYSIIDVSGKKFGTKTDLTDYNNAKQTGETITDFKEFEKFLGAKKITGNETVIGNNCDIYEISKNITLSVYNKRYILKIKTPEFVATATDLNTNPSFTSDDFELPKNVEFRNTGTKVPGDRTIDSLMKKLEE